MKKVILTVFVLLACVGGYSFYLNFFGDRSAMESQFNEALASRNPDELRRLSADAATYQYLLKLPGGTEFTKASDAQGGDNRMFYYRGELVGPNRKQGLDCYVKRDNAMPLFPKWTLYKVSVDHTYNLPEIKNMQQ